VIGQNKLSCDWSE